MYSIMSPANNENLLLFQFGFLLISSSFLTVMARTSKTIFTNNGDGLYISTTPTASARIGGYRAFFKYNEESLAPASLNLAFAYDDLTPDAVASGETTGIIIVDATIGSMREVGKNDAIYNVNGQKYSDNPLDLNNAPSGVYIIGGQTIIK